MAFLHCRNRYGLATVFQIFTGSNPTAGTLIDFRTGAVTPIVNTFRFAAYDGTASEGSTDGNLIEDFKRQKINEIFQNTQLLLAFGVSHASRQFAANEDLRSQVSLISVSGITNANAFVYDFDGIGYNMASGSDYNTYRDSTGDRYQAVIDDSGGHMDLVDQVVAAANNQAAMDAIVDGRT